MLLLLLDTQIEGCRVCLPFYLRQDRDLIRPLTQRVMKVFLQAKIR